VWNIGRLNLERDWHPEGGLGGRCLGRVAGNDVAGDGDVGGAQQCFRLIFGKHTLPTFQHGSGFGRQGQRLRRRKQGRARCFQKIVILRHAGQRSIIVGVSIVISISIRICVGIDIGICIGIKSSSIVRIIGSISIGINAIVSNCIIVRIGIRI
jgi:hypothetical protein